MSSYNFQKYCRLDQLQSEIQASSIVTAIDHIDGTSTDTTVYFKASLSAGDQTLLNTIVTDHVPAASEEIPQVVSIQEQPPFAKPDYRTKMDAVTAWESFDETVAGGIKTIDFQITEERYATGGEIILKDAKEGDYISAEVYDKDGVIPEPYRASLCEAHPSVATYITKRWLKPCATGEYGSVMIDTFPLNAKISAGLYLRVTYHVNVSEAGTRKCTINYNLTKKL